MWEYGFISEDFEIVIKAKKNPCSDFSALTELFKSIDCLTSELERKCLLAKKEDKSAFANID